MAQLSMKDAREFMNALNSFAILDANGRYTYVSENWCRMTNCTEENALGRRVEDIVPDTLAHQVYETGQPVFGHPVVLNDVTMFTNYIPRVFFIHDCSWCERSNAIGKAASGLV